jgi:hypothetical protein
VGGEQMPSSNKVQRSFLTAAALLLMGGLSLAKEPSSGDWGSAVNGLQMRISVDSSAVDQSKVPKFRVELRNVGEKDLLLNLGTKSLDGRHQYLTAVSLILEDEQGELQWLELRRSVPVGDPGTETVALPLPVGAVFSFPVDLDDYRLATSKESAAQKLKPGTYLIAAHLKGFSRVVRVAEPGVGVPVRFVEPGLLSRFDTVNPETGLGPAPVSKALRIEIPSR